MSRRDDWRKVLDAEVRLWSSKSCDQLLSELKEHQVYEVEFDSKTYQVEVQILENTPKYLHVALAVDDGTLPASLSPEYGSIIRPKQDPTS